MSHRRALRAKRGDLACTRVGVLVWCLPGLLFLAGIHWTAARPLLWIPSLVVAGSACLVNASRCGRLHCFLTGPLFLLGALGTLLDASGMLAIDWRWTLATVTLGTGFGYGLEWLRGAYVGPEGVRSRCQSP